MGDAAARVRAALEVLADPGLGGAGPGEPPPTAGLGRGFSPHPLFDPEWYATRHDLAPAEIPFVHFVIQGDPAGLSPGPYLDAAWYRRTYPDVAAAGVNTLVHYVEFGRREGRLPSPLFDPATPAGDLGAVVLHERAGGDPRWLLDLAPRPTTLARLMGGREADSFLDRPAVWQIVVRVRPAPPGDPILRAIVAGGARGVFSIDGEDALFAPGVEGGWALAHVTHAVAPAVDAAIHLLGTKPRDAAQLERWAARVGVAARALASPRLLVDETLPAAAAARLVTAAGAGAAAFRVPARRLFAVERLITLAADTSV